MDWFSRRVGASLTLLATLVLAGCGTAGGGAGNPESRLSAVEATRPISDAPRPLAQIREQANDLLEGDVGHFRERLADLEGHPVVINVWASWCGPCRHEFPFFQSVAIKRGDGVAFLGVNTEDADAAARQFLGELPLPFPSYADPDGQISRDLDVGPGLPNTIFLDRDGEVAYHLRGPVSSEAELARLVDRYAR